MVRGGESLKPKPLMIRQNGTILVEKGTAGLTSVLQMLDCFARRLKETEHLYTYQLDPCTLWQAAANGIRPEVLVRWLKEHARFPLDSGFVQQIKKNMDSFGAVRLEKYSGESFLLHSKEKTIIEWIMLKDSLFSLSVQYDTNPKLNF